MSNNRLFILIAVLILGISGISGAAGITAQAARAENAEQRVYTPYELGCMAQYYYKLTDEKGFYPPEADCKEQKDGTYLITLQQNSVDDKGNAVYTAYAQYSVDASVKGKDMASGKEIDLTLYSKVYSPEELCKLAQNYYYKINDFYPPNAESTEKEDGTYMICLFETIYDDGGTDHNSTCAWYTVNVCGIGKDDITGQSVDINP